MIISHKNTISKEQAEMVKNSMTLSRYKNAMKECIRLYYPTANMDDIDEAIDYSINKRLYNAQAQISNSYKRTRVQVKDEYGHPMTDMNNEPIYEMKDKITKMNLLRISDYIMSREPIVTAFGTMFKHHGTVPNPLFDTVQSFLDNRTVHKKQMFSFPKGSEMFEKYNLLQSLDKIDANGIYGTLGMYSSLVYNINVATSITSQGRALVSSMTLHFEMLLADNVKFGSLDQVLEFINNICKEKPNRKLSDIVLNHIPSKEECFAKLILECGYRWIPDESEMDIIWRVVNNLPQEDITRIYYKNNLYEFISNDYIFGLIKTILKKLRRPLMASSQIPPEITNEINLLSDYIFEYVYYRYMFIDRIDRCDNMIKSVTMVSDTDSTIISLDAWYRFIVERINGEELRIANYCHNPVSFFDKDEYDDEWIESPWRDPVEWMPKKLDYNFQTDEIVEMEHESRPDILTPNDNVRYSIINILAFVLDRTVNDYMEKFCENTHSLKPEYHDKCRILAKNEFTFLRLMMTMVKKNYASLIAVQEGNLVPENKQLDVKGIEALTKSSKPLSTRKALQKILLEDILKAPAIDQLKFVKDIAIFQKQIVNSVRNGSKEYYKPVTIKSKSAYDDPMRIQGIKASIAWNMIKSQELPGIDLDERNAVDIAKVNINRSTIEKIKDKYPEIYTKMVATLDDDMFKKKTKRKTKNGEVEAIVANEILAVALPIDVELPDWLEPFIDYDTIIDDNIGGFPYESVGVERFDKDNINFTNIIQL
jgi:hypothetical protein